MEQWTSTKDRREAVALGTMGCITRLHTTLDSATGNKRTRYFITLTNEARELDTAGVLAAWRRGRLEREKPAHAFLTIMRAMANRFEILDCAKKGKCIRLVQVPGTEIWQYMPGGAGLPGLQGHREVIETGDLKVAATGTAGFMSIWITRHSGPWTICCGEAVPTSAPHATAIRTMRC